MDNICLHREREVEGRCVGSENGIPWPFSICVCFNYSSGFCQKGVSVVVPGSSASNAASFLSFFLKQLTLQKWDIYHSSISIYLCIILSFCHIMSYLQPDLRQGGGVFQYLGWRPVESSLKLYKLKIKHKASQYHLCKQLKDPDIPSKTFTYFVTGVDIKQSSKIVQ